MRDMACADDSLAWRTGVRPHAGIHSSEDESWYARDWALGEGVTGLAGYLAGRRDHLGAVVSRDLG